MIVTALLFGSNPSWLFCLSISRLPRKSATERQTTIRNREVTQ